MREVKIYNLRAVVLSGHFRHYLSSLDAEGDPGSRREPQECSASN